MWFSLPPVCMPYMRCFLANKFNRSACGDFNKWGSGPSCLSVIDWPGSMGITICHWHMFIRDITLTYEQGCFFFTASAREGRVLCDIRHKSTNCWVHGIWCRSYPSALTWFVASSLAMSDESVNPSQWNNGEWGSRVQDDASNTETTKTTLNPEWSSLVSNPS